MGVIQTRIPQQTLWQLSYLKKTEENMKRGSRLAWNSHGWIVMTSAATMRHRTHTELTKFCVYICENYVSTWCPKKRIIYIRQWLPVLTAVLLGYPVYINLI